MDESVIDLLRADLETAGYSVGTVETLLGPGADAARQRGVFAPARRVLSEREDSALATLVRVFLLAEAVSEARLAGALPALGAAGAVSLGLVQPADLTGEETAYRAALSLNPVQIVSGGSQPACDWWVLSDLDDQLRGGPARPDHVMGVGGATRSLIAQAPCEPVPGISSALDLGTGCGIVAMYLAETLTHGGLTRVIATDISERAIMLARANARLNGLGDRIEFRLGNLFEPVAGEAFDLILSNPPFVITPRDTGSPVYEYRDGGMTGDELAARVISEAPAHLAPGGSLLCLANWESPWGTNGLERVRSWLDEASAAGAISAWVIERDRLTPDQYAETWARDGGARPGDAEYERLVESWLEDFAQRHVVAIGMGSVRVRREADAALTSIVHTDQATGAYTLEELGAVLQCAFAAGTDTARMPAEAVLETRWQVDAAVTEERVHRPGEEAPNAITLVTHRPIARRVTADTLLAAAVGACDGELTLQQIADALATILEVDAEAAAEALVASVRELAWLGMLAPAGR